MKNQVHMKIFYQIILKNKIIEFSPAIINIINSLVKNIRTGWGFLIIDYALDKNDNYGSFQAINRIINIWILLLPQVNVTYLQK